MDFETKIDEITQKNFGEKQMLKFLRKEKKL